MADVNYVRYISERETLGVALFLDLHLRYLWPVDSFWIQQIEKTQKLIKPDLDLQSYLNQVEFSP